MTHSLKFSFALMFAIPVLSQASVVYTNLGASPIYDINSGNFVGNAFDGNQYAEGDTFTPSANATLSSIQVALSCFDVCGPSFSVSLDSDSGGDSPGALLETFSVPGSTLGALGLNNALVLLTSVLHPALVSGTQYWLTVSAPLTDSIVWNSNSIGDTSDQAVSTDGGATWFAPSGLTPGAYEIDGNLTSSTPEPSTLLLLASGVVLIGIKRRFRV
jgi:hypothetical protein